MRCPGDIASSSRGGVEEGEVVIYPGRISVSGEVTEDSRWFQSVYVAPKLKFELLGRALGSFDECTSQSDLDKSFGSNLIVAIMSCFATLDVIGSCDSYQDFKKFMQQYADENKNGRELENNVMKRFFYGLKSKFPPLQCLYTSMATQKILKAVSRL